MGIQEFQNDVLKHGGYILSDGTLNYQHLLPKVYDFIINYEIKSEKSQQILKDILEVFIIKNENFGGEESLYIEQYWGDAELNEDKYEDASWIWNEDVFEFFSEISPTNYYFGGSEGDGACIGWWREHICSNCGKEFCEDLDDDNLCEDCREDEEGEE